MPVAATDGKTHLAYELVLTNASPHDVTLTSVDAVAAGNRLLTLSGDGLAHWTRVLANPTPTTTIRPGSPPNRSSSSARVGLRCCNTASLRPT